LLFLFWFVLFCFFYVHFVFHFFLIFRSNLFVFFEYVNSVFVFVECVPFFPVYFAFVIFGNLFWNAWIVFVQLFFDICCGFLRFFQHFFLHG
jgi:hypothetical protein